VIAEILSLSKSPQTKSFIRRQTSISYDLLQNCITQLLRKQWLISVEEDCCQRKFKITDKGWVFLEKYWELQNIMGTKSKQMPIMIVS
jgi:predicted transcriptional regulator